MRPGSFRIQTRPTHPINMDWCTLIGTGPLVHLRRQMAQGHVPRAAVEAVVAEEVVVTVGVGRKVETRSIFRRDFR
jgi:hypothetical protein